MKSRAQQRPYDDRDLRKSPMNEEIENKIIDIIANEAQIDRSRLTPASTMDEFEVPSITQFEVLFSVEEAFDIEMPDDLEDLTLRGLANTVARLVEKRGMS